MKTSDSNYLNQIAELKNEISRLQQELKKNNDEKILNKQVSKKKADEEVISEAHQTYASLTNSTGLKEHKKTIEALFESEEKFSTAFRSNPNAIVLSRIGDGFIIDVNDTFLNLFGLTREEVLGKSSLELNMFVDPRDRQKAVNILRKEGRVINHEIKIKRHSGEERTAILFVEKIQVSGEKNMLTTIQDITELKLTEKALRTSEEKYKTLFDSIDEGYCEIEMRIEPGKPLDYRFIEINQAFERQSTLTDAKGKWMREMRPDHEESWFEIYRDVALTGKPMRFESGGRALKNRWFSLYAFRIGNPEQRHVAVIFNDITERKRAEESLRISEAQLDAFFANSPAILNLVDENFCYINSDSVTPTYYGLNRETIKGKCVPDLSPDFMQQTGAVMRRVIETGDPILNAPFESPVPGWGGEIAYWRTSFFRVPLGIEKWGVGVISVEVTDIKRSEVKLRESEERFRTLADNISQFAWMADANGSVFWYNKRWYDYTGTTPEDMKGWGWMKIHHPDHVAHVTEKFKKAIDNGDNWEDTFPIRGKDGSYRWYLSRALPIRDENNNIIRWFGTNTDITEQKLTEEKLHAALFQAEEGRNTLNALMEYIPMGITIADAPDVNIRMVSRYGQELLEKSNEEIAGIPAPEHPSKWGVYHADGVTPGNPEELPLSRATMKGEIVKNEEWYVTQKDGTLIPILCNAAPILDKDGKVFGGIIGWQDIAGLKRIQREMQQRNEELTRFIYTVSHDLKSPLVTIKSFTSFLKEDIENQDKMAQERDIGYIQNAADRMGRLLDELLELSRVGRKEDPKSEVLLETIVQTAIDLVAGRISERKVKVKITGPSVLLYGHTQRLIQIYQNLLDNAVKFMGEQPEPLVEIGVQIVDNEKREIILFVRDNGQGIDPRYHHKLFGLFEKLDAKSEGTGIGLALVKRIVEVHGGSIWFASDGIDKGTTFYFTLEGTKILNK